MVLKWPVMSGPFDLVEEGIGELDSLHARSFFLVRRRTSKIFFSRNLSAAKDIFSRSQSSRKFIFNPKG